jgi:hypothetical protein
MMPDQTPKPRQNFLRDLPIIVLATRRFVS